MRAVDYKLFSFDFVAHVLDDSVNLEVVLKMFYGLNVVENFQVPVEVRVRSAVMLIQLLGDDDIRHDDRRC